MLKVDTDSTGFSALVAATDIPSGTRMIRIEDNKKLAESTWATIHISRNEHILVENKLLYTNHCCREPNARFDFSEAPWMLVSVKDIKKDEWITYDYCTTEYISGRAFDCKCGGKLCRGNYAGFKSLSTDEKELLLKEQKVSPVVKMLHEENA